MKDDELLSRVFGDEADPLRDACAGWIASSRLFRAFLEVNVGKIRRKVREAGEGERLRDVELELTVAFHLLADRRVVLVYEKYLAEKTRGPDFTVTFKGHIAFNVEVRRLRSLPSAGRLADVICEKLRQLPPAVANVLLVGVDGAGANASLDPAPSLKELLRLADAKRDDFFAQRGYRDAHDFLRAYPRLSGLLLISNWDDPTAAHISLALNTQARHPLSTDVQKLLRW